MTGWILRWYEASMTIGSGERYLPLDELEKALQGVQVQDSGLVAVRPSGSSRAVVSILTRARHAGAASARLADLVAGAAPRGWDWEGAAVTAEPAREGVRRWGRLAVGIGMSEPQAAGAALVLAGYSVTDPDPAVKPTRQECATVLEVLQMCGLTVSAGTEEGVEEEAAGA